MKKIIILTLLFVGPLSFAQPPKGGKMRERIKAQKTAFITEKLNFSSEEAAKFWPVYNKYNEQIEKKREAIRDLKNKIRRTENLSENQANNIIEQYINNESDMIASRVEMLRELKKVISATKVIKLQVVEDQFNRKLLEQVKKFRDRRKN